MSLRVSLGAAAVAASLACVSSAQAHINLTSPASREAGSFTSGLKNAPCGQGSNGRTQTVAMAEAGSTITVTWTEVANHPSYFRLAFDADGDDGFPIRTDMDSVVQAGDDPMSVNPIDDPSTMTEDGVWILGYVFDAETPDQTEYSLEVTLPNVECDNCTLQLLQFMYDKLGNQANDEYYYQCADMILTGNGGGAGGSSATGMGAAATTSTMGGSTTMGMTTAGTTGASTGFGGASAGSTTGAVGGTTGASAVGAVGAGGASSAGTTSATGVGGTMAGVTGVGGAGGGDLAPAEPQEEGCACRVPGRAASPSSRPLPLLGLLFAALGARRRMRS